MSLTITPSAINQIKELRIKENKDNFILRMRVKGGGCSGFTYVMEFIEKPEENDYVFDFKGLVVVCDPKSMKFLENIQVDFDTNLLSGGFKFNNPQAKKSCSCGESFSI